MNNQKEEIWIVYDGDCPFCANYMRYMKLKDSLNADVHLINARTEMDKVREIGGDQFDLNNGMLVKMGNSFYHGDKALHVLSLMSTNSGLFNRLVHLSGKNEKFSRLAYPVLKAGRNLVLKVLGRDKGFK